MTDYKHTLNLPTTEFPMKANLPQREPEMLHLWQELDLYGLLRHQGKNRKKFILNDGPPYANGNIHIGHALNKILKDIIVKAKTLEGFDSPFVPGWDCHGLPIELNVEKKLGKAGKDISAQDFRKACRDYANSQIDIQREEFKRLGVIGDWENPYRTMDFSFEANVVRALAKIINNGHLVRGFKPVHWCLDCSSALAEAEVEYANKISPAIDVRFRLIDTEKLLQRLGIKKTIEKISIPIWTTTPWTLPANEAVALNPEFEYVLVEVNSAAGSEVLVLAAELLAACVKRYNIEEYKELARVKGKELENLLVQHPFYDRQVPIILGEHVTLETGTGAVHTAPAHGQDDFIVAQKYHLPLVNPVGTNGCFLPEISLFAGERVLKANNHIIEILKERGNLLVQDKIEHSYPHCWRHKTPLIFLATPQWFIAIHQTKLQSASIAAAEKVKWIPDWGLNSISSMIAQRPDWCISRQRNWGTPLALLVHKQTGKLHPEMVTILEKVAKQIEQKGAEAWFSATPQDWLGAEGKDYEKVNDILEVWFDAGVVHFCVLQQRPELHFPAEVVLEGSDQYRGWFQSSLLTAVAMQIKTTAEQQAIAPYKTAITHGFTIDEQGRKMSKSLGNVIAPEKVINSLGADILRLWVASTDYRSEVAISDQILKKDAEAYRRIRNTARYFLSNLFDFNPRENLISPEQMLSLDRWAVERAFILQEEIKRAYNDYQFHLIYQKLQNFCIVDMGGFYLDIIKDRQYTMQPNSIGRRSAQTAMFHIAQALVRWIAPILSFTAEEIWRYLPHQDEKSVFLATWYENLAVSKENDLLAEHRENNWYLLMQLRNAINKEIEKCRNEGQLGSSLEAEIEIYCAENSKLIKLLNLLEDELRFVLITSVARVFSVHFPEDAVACFVDGEEIWVKVTIADYPKCIRCWHRRPDVGHNAEHPEICSRCVENVAGKGEVRKFA